MGCLLLHIVGQDGTDMNVDQNLEALAKQKITI